MTNRFVFAILLCGFLFDLSPAEARPFGSRLRRAPNTTFGCEVAPIFHPISGAPILAPTGQVTCTMRNVGYINTLQTASYVPSNGRITQFRIRSGPNPARVRLTVMQGSPGLCCTARSFSRIFRPRPNRINTFNVNMRVFRTLVVDQSGVSNTNDVIALTAVGPGSLPLRDEGTAGTYSTGSGLSQLWYPATARGEPRVEGFAMADGMELLLQWNFER